MPHDQTRPSNQQQDAPISPIRTRSGANPTPSDIESMPLRDLPGDRLARNWNPPAELSQDVEWISGPVHYFRHFALQTWYTILGVLYYIQGDLYRVARKWYEFLNWYDKILRSIYNFYLKYKIPGDSDWHWSKWWPGRKHRHGKLNEYGLPRLNCWNRVSIFSFAIKAGLEAK